MRAWQIHEVGHFSDVLELVDIPAPEPGPGQVLVEVGAAGLNFADLLVCQGRYQVRSPLPLVPGLEAAGRVVASGPAVDLPVGSRVVGMVAPPHGAFAQFTLMDAATALVLPDTVDDVTAVSMHVAYQTAWFALHRRGGIGPGDVVIVHAAAGGVGSAALELAVAAGARVVATAGGPEKVAACLNAGAWRAVDHRRADYESRIREAIGERGADLVFDPVGGSIGELSMRLLAWEGRHLVIGFASGDVPRVRANHVLVKNYSVVGVHWAGYLEHDPVAVAEAHSALLELLARGRIRPPEVTVLDMDRLLTGLSDLEERRTTGRLVLSVNTFDGGQP